MLGGISGIPGFCGGLAGGCCDLISSWVRISFDFSNCFCDAVVILPSATSLSAVTSSLFLQVTVAS